VFKKNHKVTLNSSAPFSQQLAIPTGVTKCQDWKFQAWFNSNIKTEIWFPDRTAYCDVLQLWYPC